MGTGGELVVDVGGGGAVGKWGVVVWISSVILHSTLYP